MIDYGAVLAYLCPTKAWSVSDSYESLEWRDEGEPPTLAECEAAWKEINRDYLLRPVRAERDRLLAASDWTQVPDSPVDSAAWAEYRQALRDLPENTIDPENPVWPTPPE